jgi:RHS repeat-associated protein
MTDAAKAVVWSAVYSPFGGAYTITGSETLNARFPGQWFQLEAGLHYNWHRHYDPSLGRYTQPDPLGFVDGPGVFAYARSAPHRYVDKDGRNAIAAGGEIGGSIGGPTGAAIGIGIGIGITIYQCLKTTTCTASCNVQQIDPNAVCPDRVTGGPASSKSEYLACRAAKRQATQSTPRGCYPRHCQCDCR